MFNEALNFGRRVGKIYNNTKQIPNKRVFMKEPNMIPEDIEIGKAYLSQDDANLVRRRMKIGLIVVSIVSATFCVCGIVSFVFGLAVIGASALFIGLIIFLIGVRIVGYGAVLSTKTTSIGLLVKYKNRNETIYWKDIDSINVEKHQDVNCLFVRKKNGAKQLLTFDEGVGSAIIGEFEALKQKQI